MALLYRNSYVFSVHVHTPQGSSGDANKTNAVLVSGTSNIKEKRTCYMLNIVALNINGIHNKIFEISKWLSNSNIDVVCFTETHCILNTDVPQFSGYDSFFVNRLPKVTYRSKSNFQKFGQDGILVLVKKELHAFCIPFNDDSSETAAENLWVCVGLGDVKVVVVTIYL